MPNVPPEISEYFSKLGQRGGACFTPKKAAHIANLAKARKKVERPHKWKQLPSMSEMEPVLEKILTRTIAPHSGKRQLGEIRERIKRPSEK